MRRTTKTLLAFTVPLLALVCLLIWISRGGQPAPVARETPAPPAQKTVPPAPVVTPIPRLAEATPAPSAAAAEPTPEADLPEWEYRIDQVLRSNTNETQSAAILVGMLPSLPEDGQIEAAEHISNLLPDKEYTRVMPLLTNPKLPETVLGVFMTDIMNRDDSVKLRAFLAVARVAGHPFQEEALTDLQTFIDADYGTDWSRWNAAVEAYLAKPRPPQDSEN